MKTGKKTVKIIALVMAIALSFGTLVACGEKQTLAYGKELITVKSQLDTLTQMEAGAIDVAVIDSVMAGYYASTGAYAGKIDIMEEKLAREQYGIAARKEDKAFMSEINKALIALAANGEMNVIADKFGLTSDIAVKSSDTDTYAGATDNSWEKIKSDGKIVIGYTEFAPIAFDEGNGLTGYDIELAKAVVAYLNKTYSTAIELEFLVIDWNSKEALLSGGTIDLVWNGLTITPARAEQMCISIPYLNNDQVVVFKKEDAAKYKTKADLSDVIIGVEAGSAGESVVRGE